MQEPLTRSSMLDKALALAAKGFYVFPLVPDGKTPAIAGFPQRASRDPEKVKELWTRTDPVSGAVEARSFNIGIYTGRYGDDKALLVVDVDVKKGKKGLEELKRHQFLHGVPETLSVDTPSGGLHLYYVVDKAMRQGVDVLGDGLDVRSNGGYVVAAGSMTSAGVYKWRDRRPMSGAPSWMIEAIGEPAARDTSRGQVISLLDTPLAIQRAIAYLTELAPLAIEGAGGDATTYRVAAQVKDQGVSELTTLELMASFWNPRCAPPWDYDQLASKVANAYRYGAQPLGRTLATDDDYEAQSTPPPEKQKGSAQCDPLMIEDEALLEEMEDMPHRQFIVDRFLARGYVSGLIASPGVGKSTLCANIALAVARGTGRAIGMSVNERLNVLLGNCEDDTNEMKRRIWASTLANDIPSRAGDDPKVIFLDGVTRSVKLCVRDKGGTLVRGPDFLSVLELIKTKKVGLAIFDPLVEMHEAKENDNGEMAKVMACFRDLAIQGDCAVLIVHHTRKPMGASSEGHSGSLDSARGAGSWGGAVRTAFTLSEMSEADCARYGIPEDQQFDYVKLTDAKGNIFKKSKSDRWFRKESVLLANGDDVGALVPVQLQDRQANPEALLLQELVAIFEDLDAVELPLTQVCAALRKKNFYRDVTAPAIKDMVLALLKDGDVPYEDALVSYIEEKKESGGYNDFRWISIHRKDAD